MPYVVGDSYKGVYRIVGTMPKLFGYDDDDITKTLPEREVMEYRPGRRYEIAEGRVFVWTGRKACINRHGRQIQVLAYVRREQLGR